MLVFVLTTLVFAALCLVNDSQFIMEARASVWSTPFEVSMDEGQQELKEGPGRIAVGNDGQVHIVWYGGDQNYIIYRKYDGLVWQPQFHLSDERGWSPDIAEENGHVYVIWESHGLNDYRIYFKLFNGTDWGPQIDVAETSKKPRYDPTIAVDNGSAYACWEDGRDGDPDIYCRYFDGSTWQAMEEVSEDSRGKLQRYPQVAVENGKVYVVWTNYKSVGGVGADIYFRYHDGNSWSQIKEISVDVGQEHNQVRPGISVDDGVVHVVWEEEDTHHVFYRVLNGGIWSFIVQLDYDILAVHYHHVVVSAGGGEVHAVWPATGLDGKRELYYKRFDGISWLPTERVTYSPNLDEKHGDPDLVAKGDRVHIVYLYLYYEDEPPSISDSDVYYIMGELEPVQKVLSATIDCDPNTLNVKSKGNWITCYVELPQGYDPRNINASTVLLDDILSPELNPKYGFAGDEKSYIVDYDGDGIEERMLKFDRSEVRYLLDTGNSVPLTITGRLQDGTEFEGSDMIRVIDRGAIPHSTSPHPRRSNGHMSVRV
jgi:hypothetical protein